MSTPNENSASMSILKHLDELRGRLVKATVALVIAAVFTSIFAGKIIAFLIEPYGQKLQTLGPTESVMTYMRVALMSGAAIAMPVIVYQLLAFTLPGLTRKERRWIYMSVPFTGVLFVAGVAFAWYVMVPNAIDFLANFQKELFRNEWTAGEYISFVVSIAFWIGVAFQAPLITFILAKIGLVTPGLLIRNWRIAIVVVAVVAAFITPTVDPFNMAILMLPLLALYVLSIFLAMVATRGNRD